MTRRRTTLALSLLAAAALAAAAFAPFSTQARGQQAEPWKTFDEEWRYPGASPGSSSGGQGGGTIKLQSQSTTPDRFDEVARFYALKAGSRDGSPRNEARAELGKSGPKGSST